MLFQLDKWYLDCQTPEEFGYYYINRLRFGGLKVVSVEIDHHAHNEEFHWHRMGREVDSGRRILHGAGARIQVDPHNIELRIATDEGTLHGTWHCPTGPIARQVRPLYRDRHGWCDWKVWSPFAEVELTLFPGRRSPLRGFGYVDFVRFTIPFWRISFHSLCWGRLFAGRHWIIMQRLQTPSGTLSWAMDDEGHRYSTDAEVIRERRGTIRAFKWRMGEDRIYAEVIHELQAAPLLSQDRIGRWIPARILDRLGSGGFEEKFLVEAHIRGRIYTGPMEEVRWHGA